MGNNTTKHTVLTGNARNAEGIAGNSIDLVVTSPPYPMIQMWDESFCVQNPQIKAALTANQGERAFELMHRELDKVWADIGRVLRPGGIVCINIGDATRTIKENFRLYNNHARILHSFLQLGFSNLPNIIWRKQTNAPNKFMGSGMLPAGAYVTLEHEWILIFRKEGKRLFKTSDEKEKRRQSSFFWEERNTWFSDLWTLKGVRQVSNNKEARDRSAAYPFDLPYRLINMYSLKGDTIYDPFLGTGTTIIAALACERNSIGMEIEDAFSNITASRIENLKMDEINRIIKDRMINHQLFVLSNQREFNHYNTALKVRVVTSQETGISFSYLKALIKTGAHSYEVSYQIVQDQEDVSLVETMNKMQGALDL